MQFREGAIEKVIWKPLKLFNDPRGWLCELFRQDELLAEFHPVMAYISETKAGVRRGPHEHVRQADCFGFLGPGNFQLYLWDNRTNSPTYRNYESARLGQDHPMMVIIPPGVVHAYQNIGQTPGWVINCPNQLFRGANRKDEVDEIRHEDDPNSIFVLSTKRAA